MNQNQDPASNVALRHKSVYCAAVKRKKKKDRKVVIDHPCLFILALKSSTVSFCWYCKPNRIFKRYEAKKWPKKSSGTLGLELKSTSPWDIPRLFMAYPKHQAALTQICIQCIIKVDGSDPISDKNIVISKNPGLRRRNGTISVVINHVRNPGV